MTNRRQFFGKMTCAVVPLVTGLPQVLLAVGQPALPFHAVLFDSSLPEVTVLRRRLGATDAAVHHIEHGDLTDFWLHTLAPQWRHKPLPIAGVTHSAALMCLEQLAYPHGMRVLFHAEHLLRADGRVDHEIHRLAPGLEQLTSAALHTATGNWCAPVVAALGRFAPGKPAVAQGLSCAGLEPTLQAQEQLLTSWIIAPV